MSFCDHAGYTEMFQNCMTAGLYRGAWKIGDGVRKQLFYEDCFVEWLPDPAYTHLTR